MTMVRILILAGLAVLPLGCAAVRYDMTASPDRKILCTNGPAMVFVSVAFARSPVERKLLSESNKRRSISSKTMGGGAVLANDTNSADILIHITETPFYTLDQEYLTGLSFGIIPNWGTRKSKYTYRLATPTDVVILTVDERSFNHIPLTPVCLLELPFMTEMKIYRRALKKQISTQPTSADDSSTRAAACRVRSNHDGHQCEV